MLRVSSVPDRLEGAGRTVPSLARRTGRVQYDRAGRAGTRPQPNVTPPRRETGPIAEALIAQAVEQQQITREQLIIHADRGIPLRSKPVAFLLADLGVTKTHSRPYTSTDNPYSWAHFKTLKYRPEFPERSETIEQAREFCRGFCIGTTTSTATQGSG